MPPSQRHIFRHPSWWKCWLSCVALACCPDALQGVPPQTPAPQPHASYCPAAVRHAPGPQPRVPLPCCRYSLPQSPCCCSYPGAATTCSGPLLLPMDGRRRRQQAQIRSRCHRCRRRLPPVIHRPHLRRRRPLHPHVVRRSPFPHHHPRRFGPRWSVVGAQSRRRHPGWARRSGPHRHPLRCCCRCPCCVGRLQQEPNLTQLGCRQV